VVLFAVGPHPIPVASGSAHEVSYDDRKDKAHNSGQLLFSLHNFSIVTHHNAATSQLRMDPPKDLLKQPAPRLSDILVV
jgi:hypothetical protein